MATLADFRGTVSHGTLRHADVMPALLATLRSLLDVREPTVDTHSSEVVGHRRARKLTHLVHMRMAKGPAYFDSEQADWDSEELFEALTRFAPDGYTFGAHPGDGSDFGFWEVEE